MPPNNNKTQFANLPVLPLFLELGKLEEDQIELPSALAVIKVRGDGNCGLRAIIQALLIQGIVQDKRDKTITFLKSLCIKTEKEVKASYGLDKQADFEAFMQQYACLTPGKEVETFFKQYFPLVNREKEIEDIKNLNKIPEVLATEDNTLMERYYHDNPIVPDPLPPGDDMIYYLSACLRKDISSFNPTVLDAQVIGYERINAELDQAIEFASVIPYLKKYSIIVEQFGIKNNEMGNAEGLDENKNVVYGEGVVFPEFNIKILHTGGHFVTLLAEEELVNYKEKCQITADEAYACQLAIKEIDKEELRTLADPLQQEEYARKRQAERYQFFKRQKVKTANEMESALNLPSSLRAL